MAIDNKYGRVTMEHSTIGEDEPVVVFRAQDAMLPRLMEKYLEMCAAAGSPARHLDLIKASIDKIVAWQETHHTQVPRSDQLKAAGE